MRLKKLIKRWLIYQPLSIKARELKTKHLRTIYSDEEESEPHPVAMYGLLLFLLIGISMIVVDILLMMASSYLHSAFIDSKPTGRKTILGKTRLLVDNDKFELDIMNFFQQKLVY